MKLSDLTLSASIADLIDARGILGPTGISIDNHLNLIVWYSREGVQFVGTRAEHDAFVLSGE